MTGNYFKNIENKLYNFVQKSNIIILFQWLGKPT